MLRTVTQHNVYQEIFSNGQIKKLLASELWGTRNQLGISLNSAKSLISLVGNEYNPERESHGKNKCHSIIINIHKNICNPFSPNNEVVHNPETNEQRKSSSLFRFKYFLYNYNNDELASSPKKGLFTEKLLQEEKKR